MKRAMGLMLGVLAFALAAHADRMVHDGSSYVAAADLRSQAAATEPLLNSNLLTEPEKPAFRAGGDLSEPGDGARSTDYVFYSHFAGDSSNTIEGSVELDSLWISPERILGDPSDEAGKRSRIEHPNPFHRALGVQEVPESGTLLLLGAGFGVVVLWKRRTIAA